MTENTAPLKNISGPVFFLSEILGARALLASGKKVGKLSDLLIKENGKVPVVTHFYITRPFGYPALLVPWENVKSLTNKTVEIDIESVEKYEGMPGEDAVLLKDYILDKKVLDLEGNEVEVVYDVKLVMRDNKLYVTDVDLSRYGFFRRMHLKSFANFLYNLANMLKSETLSWTYIQPLPQHLGRFRGDVRLKVLKDKLSDVHPVDLADMLEEMDREQRTIVFNELEPERASDTLEEINPNVQRELISTMSPEKVAQLLNEMTPGQAADILMVLPSSDASDLLQLLKPENAQKVQSIVARQEEKILNFATNDFLKFSPERTVEQTQKAYRRVARGKAVVMYLYIVDEDDRLLGVIDIKELLQAPDEAKLKDVMIDKVISLKPDSTLREASEELTHYGFRAIPITDGDNKILGVVPYRDVMSLKHRFLE
jgi:magnesium transporter